MTDDVMCPTCGARYGPSHPGFKTSRRKSAPCISTDPGKLRTLADWFDVYDNNRGEMGAREVQADLRRIADVLEDRASKPLKKPTRRKPHA